MFPKIGVPENGWFIMENPIKMYDLGVTLFLETPIYHRHNYIKYNIKSYVPWSKVAFFFGMGKSRL